MTQRRAEEPLEKNVYKHFIINYLTKVIKDTAIWTLRYASFIHNSQKPVLTKRVIVSVFWITYGELNYNRLFTSSVELFMFTPCINSIKNTLSLSPLWTARLHNRLIWHWLRLYRRAQKNHFVVLAEHRTAPWWWFLREPKRVGASIIILKLF